ncbi:MAG: hypothetical protein ABIQ30_06865 [Devosia sp.]
MRLPQSRVLFKAMFAFLLVLPLAFASAVLAADASTAPHLTLFSCTTDAVDDAGYLSLEGVEVDYKTWKDLRFVQKANGDGRELYRFEPKDYKTSFLFSNSDGPEGYLVSIRWVDRGTNYVYYSLYVPPDPAVEDDMGGGEAGLVVSKDGKLIDRADCTERPYMFISYMQSAMSCDINNPFGEAACSADKVYNRTEPFDIGTIGIGP